MSSIGLNVVRLSVLLVLCVLASGCLDQASGPQSRDSLGSVPPKVGFRKGNTTLQMDVSRSENGDLWVSLVSQTDVPYVDIRTRSGEEWLDLARLYDLKAGEIQTRTLADPQVAVDHLWAVAGGGGPRWATQSRVVASESLTQASPAALKTQSPSDGHTNKLRVLHTHSQDFHQKIMQ